MTEIDKIKKYANWPSVIESDAKKYNILFHDANDIYTEINNIKSIYTGTLSTGYFIVVTSECYYMGLNTGSNANTVVCFAKFKTLKEVCNAL